MPRQQAPHDRLHHAPSGCLVGSSPRRRRETSRPGRRGHSTPLAHEPAGGVGGAAERRPPDSGVVRIGDTVRRPTGRQSRSFLGLLRDATAGPELARGHEVVCHNDPSPCNYVFVDGHRVSFIGFDHAAPGDRLRDVAYAGWLWTISADDGPPLPVQARTTAADGRRVRPARHVRSAGRRASPAGGEPRGRAYPAGKSPDPTVAEYGRTSATRQREQLAWLREHADAFRAALATGESRPADWVACSRSCSPARRAPARRRC
ncbi:MAG: phosphotransferase [Solirubrobacteraceae bacterium]